VGAGYSSATGPNLQGQVSQTNFLGKGQNLSAKINFAKDQSIYEFNFTEPYFLDTDWSAGVDVFQNQSERLDFEDKIVGGAVRLGHPLGEYLEGSIRYGYKRSYLTPTYDSGPDNPRRFRYTDFTIFPLDEVSGDTSSVTGTLEYDKRNDRFSPSKGIYASSSLEYAGLGGNLKYTKGVARFRYFYKVFWEVVWRNNLQYAFISPHDTQKDPPFNELFLLGGPYSLRGYYQGRIGKTKFSQQYKDYLTDPTRVNRITDEEEAKRRAERPFGGRQQVLLQTELEFPLVGEAGIKGVFFYDLGQAEDIISPVGFYSNVGFGFRWFSPLGPLRFEWGFPLRPAPLAPEPVVFEFSIGAPF
jgi:outer membrane protein insertion porin family